MNEKDLALTILRKELDRKKSDYRQIKISIKHCDEEYLNAVSEKPMGESLEGNLSQYFTVQELIQRITNRIADLENCINWAEKA